MISGTLIKFEPTKEGITVMVRVPRDQMHQVVDLYEQEVTVGILDTGIPTGEEPQHIAVILSNIRIALRDLEDQILKPDYPQHTKE